MSMDDRVDAGAAPLGIPLADPVPNEGEVQRGLTLAVEVIVGNAVLTGRVRLG
jgi:hypothetical protein